MIDSPVNKPCTSDADCPGDLCAEIVPGGYRTCLRKAATETSCSSYPGQDACGCQGSTCPSGSRCVLDDSPSCGTGGTGPNVCASGCTPGACPSGEACLRGLQPLTGACYPAACRTDQDCGGCSRCAPYWTDLGGDCSGALQGLKCTCRTNADCKPGLHCAMGTGGYSGSTGFCL